MLIGETRARGRVPIHDDDVYWSMVFPLGMYTVSTQRLMKVIDEPILDVIPRYTMLIALAAWMATFIGLLHQLLRRCRAA